MKRQAQFLEWKKRRRTEDCGLKPKTRQGGLNTKRNSIRGGKGKQRCRQRWLNHEETRTTGGTHHPQQALSTIAYICGVESLSGHPLPSSSSNTHSGDKRDATQTHGLAAGGWPRCEDQLHRGAPLCLVELLACACTTRHNNTKNKSESTRKPLEKGIRGR